MKLSFAPICSVSFSFCFQLSHIGNMIIRIIQLTEVALYGIIPVASEQ